MLVGGLFAGVGGIEAVVDCTFGGLFAEGQPLKGEGGPLELLH